MSSQVCLTELIPGTTVSTIAHMLTTDDRIDPVLYERLIKRFQSQQERTEEGKAKGYGRTLEASLIRGETNLANLSASATPATAVASAFSEPPAPTSSTSHSSAVPSSNGTSSSNPLGASDAKSEAMSTDRPWDQPVADKQKGLELWREFLEFRFVHGRDDEFDYAKVDEEEDLDTLKHRDAEDDWYDDEEPSWVDDDGDTRLEGDDALRKGETGIQDF